MTARTPAYLKARFEQGDIPQGTDYEDVFDSYLNVATSAVQTLTGGLYAPEFSTPLVSASVVRAGSINITGSASYVHVEAQRLVASAASITAAISAASGYFNNFYLAAAADVSAVATTQAGALTISAPANFVIFADGNNNAVKLPASDRGKIQYVINASTTTIKIFPATSGRFLVTAVNASLNIPADKVATVIHKGDDRYGIQIG